MCSHSLSYVSAQGSAVSVGKLQILLYGTVFVFRSNLCELKNNSRNKQTKAPTQCKNYHMGSFPQDGENEQNLSYFFSSLELYCDQTVLFFQVFSIVLKRLCPLQSKNTFVLVPAIFFRFLKNLCFWPKISFFGNLWRSRATKPSELDWIWPVHNFGG